MNEKAWTETEMIMCAVRRGGMRTPPTISMCFEGKYFLF